MGTTNILDLNNRLTKVEKENIAQNSYTSLKNKPKINNVTLTGNKSLADIGAAAADDLTTLAGEVGTLTNLTTTDKSSCVGAINEVNGSKSNLLVVEIKELTTDAVPANSYKDFSVSATKSGYTPIGIVGVRISAATELAINYFYLDSTDVKLRLNNNTSITLTPNIIYVWVLYVQN